MAEHSPQCFTVGTFHPQFTDGNRDYPPVIERLARAACDLCCVQGVTSQFNRHLRKLEGFEVQSAGGLGLVANTSTFTVAKGGREDTNLLERVVARVEDGSYTNVQLPDSTVSCKINLRIPACVWRVQHVASGATVLVANFDFSVEEAREPSLRRALIQELCTFLWDPEAGLCALCGCQTVVLAGHVGVPTHSEEWALLLAPLTAPDVRRCELSLLEWSVMAHDAATNHCTAFYQLPPYETTRERFVGLSAARAHYGDAHAWHGHSAELLWLETACARDGSFRGHDLSDAASSADEGWCSVSHTDGGTAMGRILRIETSARVTEAADALPVLENPSPAAVEIRAHFAGLLAATHKPVLASTQDCDAPSGLRRGDWICYTPATLRLGTSDEDATNVIYLDDRNELHWASLCLN